MGCAAGQDSLCDELDEARALAQDTKQPSARRSRPRWTKLSSGLVKRVGLSINVKDILPRTRAAFFGRPRVTGRLPKLVAWRSFLKDW
jgi:hypothetical protein